MVLTGLKEAENITLSADYRNGGKVQISLNLATGEILTDYHVGNDYTVYDDFAIKTVFFAREPITMEEIEAVIDAFILSVWEDMNS